MQSLAQLCMSPRAVDRPSARAVARALRRLAASPDVATGTSSLQSKAQSRDSFGIAKAAKPRRPYNKLLETGDSHMSQSSRRWFSCCSCR